LRAEDETTRENVSADSVGIIVIADMNTSSNTSTTTSGISAIEGVGDNKKEEAQTEKAKQTGNDKTTKQPHILLLKQFRPPIDRVCIEIPAGLIDSGESPQTCALRELKEETGYTGTIIPSSSSTTTTTLTISHQTHPYPGPTHFNDPGFTNTATHLIHIAVDLTDPRNSSPDTTRQLEENEHVEALWVPVARLYETCVRLEREEGYAIDARVGTLAEGLEMARRLGL